MALIGYVRISTQDQRAAAVAVVDQSHPLDRLPLMDSLFQSIEDEPGMRGSTDAPADALSWCRT